MPAAIRTCVATDTQHPQSDLLRFVLSPEGELLCDITGKLPGRGAWVTPEPEAILIGLRNGGFSRTLKTKVQAEGQELLTIITEQLKARTLYSLHFCKKAGELVSGYEKVLAQLKKAQISTLIIASDASGDVKKSLLSAAQEQVKWIESFSRDVLAEIIGKENAVYTGLSGGNATDNFMQEYARFTRFREYLTL